MKQRSADFRGRENISGPLSCFPYGAGQGKDGVCLLVQMGEYRLLLDCGLMDISPLTQRTQPPADLVFCSHGGGDRARGLLPLHRHFPNLPIYGSEVTAHLLPLNWPEEEVPSFCQTVPWQSPFPFFNNLQAQIFPAGHLPGSASILLTYTTAQRTYTILHTSDFFLSHSRLVDGLSLESLRGASPDVLIVEGNYGTARHPRRRQLEKQLLDLIEESIMRGRSILIPVPPLGLAQEILVLLRSHHQFTGRDLDIWVTGLASRACDLYLEILPHLPASVQNFSRHQSLFWDNQILPKVGRLELEPEQPINTKIERFPCVILTSDIENWQDYCIPEVGAWQVLLPEQPRRQRFKKPANLPAHIEVKTFLLPDHSDGRNLTQLIHNIRPQHLVFIGGSAEDLTDLTSLEELQNRYQLHSPPDQTLVELPLGDRFLQPPTPTESYYEGEIQEQEAGIHVILPSFVNRASRWANFADTGIIEARWQGDELVLKGVSQQELLKQTNSARIESGLECCRNCRYHRGQHCYNPVSPLYTLKVTLEGCCPVFEDVDTDRHQFDQG